jgi:hypothetical protein
MRDETLTYVRTFGQIIDDLVATLTGLDDAALNTPINLDEANTMAALATHTVAAGEFWTLVLVGGQRIPRDRPAEFHAVDSGPALAAFYGFLVLTLGWFLVIAGRLWQLAPETPGQAGGVVTE